MSSVNGYDAAAALAVVRRQLRDAVLEGDELAPDSVCTVAQRSDGGVAVVVPWTNADGGRGTWIAAVGGDPASPEVLGLSTGES